MSASVMIFVGLLLAVAGVWPVRLVLVSAGVLAFVVGLLAARVDFFVVGLVVGRWRERMVGWATAIGGSALVLAGIGRVDLGVPTYVSDPQGYGEQGITVAAWVVLAVLVLRQDLNACPLGLFIQGLGAPRALLNDLVASLMVVVAPPMNMLAFYVNRFAAPAPAATLPKGLSSETADTVVALRSAGELSARRYLEHFVAGPGAAVSVFRWLRRGTTGRLVRMTPTGHLDTAACYRAVSSRDRRFDGVFYTAVRTTGIYCRPSCPARTPAAANVVFHPSAASAQAAGFRACKRCLPDATPGSPEWDVAGDVAGRAMRLIADGLVDREGVGGLADRVGYTPRHLGRVLGRELGASPLALARARRAQTARVLIETTDLPLTDVAFAAGFASVRQFNETVREVYAASPSQLRASTARATQLPSVHGALRMRLAVRAPFAGRRLLDFLAYHLVPGVEVAGRGWYARTLDLPHGPGTVRLDLDDVPVASGTGFVVAEFALTDLRDTSAAVERVRRLLDADCDPIAVDDHLGRDPLLGPLVRATPGLRVPGQVDGDETAVRTVIGQQVSVTGARTVGGRIVAEHGRRVDSPVPGLTHLFPGAAVLASVDPETLPMPRARGRALVGLASALTSGAVVLDRGPDRDDVRRALLALPGIGPWTADYVAMRALGHPDVFLPTDLAVRRVLADLGGRAGTEADPVAWRPWRSYALMHLWNTLMPETPSDEGD